MAAEYAEDVDPHAYDQALVSAEPPHIPKIAGSNPAPFRKPANADRGCLQDEPTDGFDHDRAPHAARNR